jgi:hypothetical protein
MTFMEASSLGSYWTLLEFCQSLHDLAFSLHEILIFLIICSFLGFFFPYSGFFWLTNLLIFFLVLHVITLTLFLHHLKLFIRSYTYMFQVC